MAEPAATITINSDNIVGDIEPTIYGGFVEHLGRCVYGGIYDPQSPRANKNGLRTDVLDALREMRLSTIRYPGGNFVSGYDWRDGVGPKAERPRRRELAWKSIETNQFGTNEFIDFCRGLKVEPMMGMNFGTGTIGDAANLLEYCNAPAGTKYADLRVSHGYKEPHRIKYWCLGNEMDGPWQIGHMDAVSYAKKALEAAKMMKTSDASIKTILCGSSGPFMKTYPDWDRTALEIAWSQTDYLSIHNYATNRSTDPPGYLGYSVEFESHIDTLATILRQTRQKLGAKHDIYLSQDEWNIWYKDRDGDGQWHEAPPLLEETYTLEDTLVFAMWLNVFLRKCDILKMACLAQVVNVIGPLKTKRDALLKESTYYTFLMYTQHARGKSIRPEVQAPVMATQRFGDIPAIDAAATTDPATGRSAIFLIHRSATETLMTEIVFEGGKTPSKVTDAQQIWGIDPHAANTFDRPDVITPRQVSVMPFKDRRLPLKLPPLSVTMVLLEE